MRLPEFTAEASLYQTGKGFRLEHAHEDFAKGENGTLYPAAVFRGCYYGPYALGNCNLMGQAGVLYGWWMWYDCRDTYCYHQGFGLVTER